MTQPRFIAPEETLLITVRTVARFYLLRPDPGLVEAVKYCLAHYSKKHGISLHAVCVMSTHFHLVVYDSGGNRSLFLRDLNRGIANFVKALRGWRGPVFRPKPNIVRLLTKKAIIEKIGYVLANPVAAGAVKRFAEWPGLCDAAGLTNHPQHSVALPELFFSASGRLPAAQTFELETSPVLLDAYGESDTKRLLRAAASRQQAKAQKEVLRLNWKVRGARHCLRVSPFRRARAYEVFGATEPTFAVLGGGKELYIRAAAELRSFRRRYRVALERWREKKRGVVFPSGTWLMRVLHGVRCECWQLTRSQS